jgi:hypothetical protein
MDHPEGAGSLPEGRSGRSRPSRAAGISRCADTAQGVKCLSSAPIQVILISIGTPLGDVG